jgi:hypothetical protein
MAVKRGQSMDLVLQPRPRLPLETKFRILENLKGAFSKSYKYVFLNSYLPTFFIAF